MLLRKVAAAATVEVAMEVVTAVEGIFTVVADTSAAMVAGISAAAVRISVAAGATSAVDRLRDRVFAAIVLSPSITPDPTPCGR
jgi:hypothetical protein